MMEEKMKPSGIAWIGDIPKSWFTKRIKYLASLKGRIGWQGLTSDEYIDEGPYLITGVDFQNGGIDWNSCVHISEERWAEAPEIHIQNGDLLITKDGTVGKVAIVSDLVSKASLNSGVLLVRTLPAFDKRFLFWVLQSEEFWSWFRLKNAGNSTIVHLYQGDFAEFCYTYPELQEQQAIADYLDTQCAKIDSIAADLEKQIELLQKYKKSLITETVTKGLDKSVPMKDSGIEWIGKIPEHWIIIPVKHIMDVISKGATPDDMVSNPDETHFIKFVKAENIKNGVLHYTPEFYIDKIANSMLRRSELKENDILFVIAGATIGKTAIVPKLDCSCNINQAVCFLRLRKKYQSASRYIYYVLQSKIITEVIKLYTVQSAQPNLSMADIGNIQIPLPEEDEMLSIASMLDIKSAELDEIIHSKEASLLTLKNTRKSLIYEYVTGKKRVKEAQ